MLALSDPDTARSMGARAHRNAASSSWWHVAGRLLEAIEGQKQANDSNRPRSELSDVSMRVGRASLNGSANTNPSQSDQCQYRPFHVDAEVSDLDEHRRAVDR